MKHSEVTLYKDNGMSLIPAVTVQGIDISKQGHEVYDIVDRHDISLLADTYKTVDYLSREVLITDSLLVKGDIAYIPGRIINVSSKKVTVTPTDSIYSLISFTY